MAKKHFYAVAKGRKPGIYQHWSGAGGAEEQVKGFPGALFQGFETRAQAESYLSGSVQRIDAARQPALHQGGADDQAPVAAPDYQPDLAAGRIVVFTDGSSIGNPGRGGYGVVVLDGGSRTELSGGFRCTTNNRMELMACIAALGALGRTAPVVLYSDSRYVVEAVNKGWAYRWRKNGWLRAPDSQGIQQPAENIDLWETFLALLDRCSVTFRWVKGHANQPENERCDRLAVQSARGRNLPLDPGYRGSCEG